MAKESVVGNSSDPALDNNGVSLTPDIETASDRYATRFSGEVGTFFLELQERFVLEALREAVGESTGYSVLEVGGGHNQLTTALLRTGAQVITHGTNSACASRHQATYSASEAPFVVSSFRDLPFPDKSIDVVISVRFIAHISDWEGFLGECCRVARRAVIIDYAPREGFNILTPILYQVKKRIEQTTRPYLCHWSGDLHRAFKRFGAREVSGRREMFVPMGIHRKLGSKNLSSSMERFFGTLGVTKLLGSPGIVLARF